jgi:hypothetical protein
MIEQRFKEAIDRWVTDACPMGGFITAVLENDLRGAIGRADEDAFHNIKDIVRYLWNEVPAPCWGSKEKVKAWKGLKEGQKSASGAKL